MADQFDSARRISFMRITTESRELLRELRDILEHNLDPILDDFYSHVTSIPELAAKFSGASHIGQAREAQKRHWLNGVFSARFDNEYMQGVNRIGRTHERIGLEPRWYMGGYALALEGIQKLVIDNFGSEPEKMTKMLASVNQAVFLDMDLAISVFIDTARENTQKTLNEHADQFEQTVLAIVNKVSEASANMNNMAQTMAAAAEETHGQADAVAAASEEMTQSINEISQQTARASEITGEAVAQTHESNERIQGLNEAAKQIGEVVKLINDIASQTNLLALNAAIEAAHAGDAGRGFAIVANEVKNLATQTSAATEDISKQIHQIQTATAGAVQSIGGITGTIDQISEIASSISSAVSEQTAATQDVTTNILGVSQASQSTGNAACEALEAAQDLTERSQALEEEVHRFLDQVRAG